MSLLVRFKFTSMIFFFNPFFYLVLIIYFLILYNYVSIYGGENKQNKKKTWETDWFHSRLVVV